MRFTIAARLIALLALALVFLATVGAAALLAARAMSEVIGSYADDKVPQLQSLSRLATATGRVAGAASALENGSLDEAVHAPALEIARTQAAVADEAARAFVSARGADGAQASQLPGLIQAWRTGLDALVAAAGERSAASEAGRFAEMAALQQRVTSQYEDLRRNTQRLFELLDESAANVRAEATALQGRASET